MKKETFSLAGKLLLVAMRHEKSIAAVWGYVSGLGLNPADFCHYVLERAKDSPQQFEDKKTDLMQKAKTMTAQEGAIVLASKINDAGDNSELIGFLQDLRDRGQIGQMPVIITHLGIFSDTAKQDIDALSMNIILVEQDNLGFPKPTDAPDSVRTGLSKLGPTLLDVYQ